MYVLLFCTPEVKKPGMRTGLPGSVVAPPSFNHNGDLIRVSCFPVSTSEIPRVNNIAARRQGDGQGENGTASIARSQVWRSAEKVFWTTIDGIEKLHLPIRLRDIRIGW